MKSGRWILAPILGLLTSFFYFPIEFKFLPPGLNTKLMLACLGGALYFIQAAKKRQAKISTNLFLLTVFACVFSLVCFFATTYNGTIDYAYATYVMSMWVWLGAAYFVAQSIKLVHGKIDFPLGTHYLLGVCIAQCFLALLIDQNPALKAFVDSYVQQGQDFLNSNNVKRLYGLGASLDTAGVRFSIVLALLAHLVVCLKEDERMKMAIYLASFAVLTVVGSMIARTTYVGVGLFLLYVCYMRMKGVLDKSVLRVMLRYLGIVVLIVVPLSFYFYYNDAAFRHNIRFAFEGFYSLAEKGKWEITSNETLQTMVVFPDNLKTWIIGDGYFDAQGRVDPYYVGNSNFGYYMGTDVGYCRFIFYCGVIGLFAFSVFMIKAAHLCMSKFASLKALMFFLLVVNFVVWAKVATDIFLIFAFIICLDEVEEEDEEELLLEPAIA